MSRNKSPGKCVKPLHRKLAKTTKQYLGIT